MWEYFNEIVGGTENAYTCFCDEGIYLGQRYYVLRDFMRDSSQVDQEIPFHAEIWLMEEEWKADRLNFQTIVPDIYDDNMMSGIDGYYVEHMCNFLAWNNWDPIMIDTLEKVKRIGNMQVIKGKIIDPRAWASGMFDVVLEHIRTAEEPEWEVVVARLEQITSQYTWVVTSFVLLGNGYLALLEKDKALTAYRTALKNLSEDDVFKTNLQTHIQLIENSSDLTKIPLLRPSDLE